MQVYTTAETALADGQTKLEQRLQSPHDMQDMLSAAKASMPPLPTLPPPPDPIQQAIGSFADAALGKLSEHLTFCHACANVVHAFVFRHCLQISCCYACYLLEADPEAYLLTWFCL